MYNKLNVFSEFNSRWLVELVNQEINRRGFDLANFELIN